MRPEPRHKIDIRALTVWRWEGAITSFLMAAAGGVLLFLTIKFDWPYWISAIVWALIAIGTVWFVVIVPKWSWHRWRYEIREEEIDLQRGIIFRTRTIIPMVRVQHVDTNQGPIMRKFGLSTVTFSTAAGGHEIPALANETADQVRDRIAELARVSNEDV
ncbi:Bacterial membrane flanked domain [Chlamydia abortus]|uniref:PH domain-containing protein n=1 Tax=Paenibacillus residui TaxID=629724 RepID=A0ABW3D732_9BACL|nr:MULTISPECIES: PH domain-containing protein [Paenibacillaceae]SHE12495.1 Bacterial membrane flanked domain [Chlamydia abortus]